MSERERDLPKTNGSLLARNSMVADDRYAREGRFVKRGMVVQPLGCVLPLGLTSGRRLLLGEIWETFHNICYCLC